MLEGCRTALLDGRGLPRVDGPSDVLLKVMAEHGYVAPPDWQVRELPTGRIACHFMCFMQVAAP